MYDLIPCFFGGMMILLGLYMFICPVKATKESLRSDNKMVSRTKRNGIVVICCGILAIAIMLFK